MANIGNGKPLSTGQVSLLLTFFLDHYKTYGFGPWAVVKKENMEVIGINGIKYLPNFSHPDFGFAFIKDEWSKGFGFETSTAVLQYAQQNLNLKKIGATVSPKNIPSKKLLEKLGLKYHETVTRDSLPIEVYYLKS